MKFAMLYQNIHDFKNVVDHSLFPEVTLSKKGLIRIGEDRHSTLRVIAAGYLTEESEHDLGLFLFTVVLCFKEIIFDIFSFNFDKVV